MHKGHIIPRDKCSKKNKAGERATKGRPEAWMKWGSKPVH